MDTVRWKRVARSACALVAVWLASKAVQAQSDASARAGAGAAPAVSAETFDQLDALEANMRQVVIERGLRDLQWTVVHLSAIYEIGTVLQPGTSVPYDDSACAPSVEPKDTTLTASFPTYRISSKLAGKLSLGEKLLSALALGDLRAEGGNETTLLLELKQPRMRVLPIRSFQALLRTPACLEALRSAGPGEELLLVVGYIKGKRNLSIETKANASTGLALRGLFSAGGSNDRQRTLSISDEAEERFLQIVVPTRAGADGQPIAALPQRRPPAAAVMPPPPPPPTPSVVLARPTTPVALPAPATGEFIFDPPAAGPIDLPPPRPVVRQLSTARGQVVVLAGQAAAADAVETTMRALAGKARVQRVADRFVPARTDVRYFHDEDAQAAQSVLALLRDAGNPEATLSQSSLPAARGRVEVWLHTR